MTDYSFKTKPFQHQLDAFNRSRDSAAYAYFMEQGTGKSKVLTDVAGYLFSIGKINALLIVAPKSVCRNWVQDQIPAHMPDRIFNQARVVLWKSADNKKNFEERRSLFVPDPLSLKVLVMNIDAFATAKGLKFATQFVSSHDSMIAVDESSTIKNPTALRTKGLMKLAKLAKARRVLSGTPITQSPLDLYSQLAFLSDDIVRGMSFFAFRNRYAVMRKRYINGRNFDEVIGYQKLDELKNIVDEHGTVIKKQDCLDLPDKIYQRVDVELSPEQRKIYDTLKQKAVVELSETDSISAPLALTKLLRLRQVLCGWVPLDGQAEGVTKMPGRNNRLEALVDTLRQIDSQAVVWANFRASIEEIRGRLEQDFGIGCVMEIHGGIGTEERQEAVTKFQSGEIRFIVGNPRTGGYGLTLTSGCYMIYYDNDWSLEVRLQSEDRIHRIGQVKNCTYIDLVAPNTVDEQVHEALRRKENLAAFISRKGWKGIFEEGLLDDPE